MTSWLHSFLLEALSYRAAVQIKHNFALYLKTDGCEYLHQ